MSRLRVVKLRSAGALVVVGAIAVAVAAPAAAVARCLARMAELHRRHPAI
jgi:hypothetical protein